MGGDLPLQGMALVAPSSGCLWVPWLLPPQRRPCRGRSRPEAAGFHSRLGAAWDSVANRVM